MTPRPRTHSFAADPDAATDRNGERYCRPPCGLPERHASHTLPEPDPAQAALTARMLGEHQED